MLTAKGDYYLPCRYSFRAGDVYLICIGTREYWADYEFLSWFYAKYLLHSKYLGLRQNCCETDRYFN